MSESTKEPTRYYSNKQEKSVSKDLGAFRQSNSGAGHFNKGDCVQKEASLLIECKTTTSSKNTFSIHKDWLEKNKKEAFSNHLFNCCLAFNFGPEEPNYFVIDNNLMNILIEKLKEDNK